MDHCHQQGDGRVKNETGLFNDQPFIGPLGNLRFSLPGTGELSWADGEEG
jgi:hypothetical protein